MSNYVWNKVICDKDTLDKYFIDYKPFGEDESLIEPYITFNKLFNVESLYEYGNKYDVDIYYGRGFLYKTQEDGRFEILFCTKWKYPIEAIKKTLTLSRNTEWYAVEENRIYVSRFYWDNGIKEGVIVIEDGYYQWCHENEDLMENIEDPDDGVWHYLESAKEEWQNWESVDDFKRYEDAVVKIKLPFYK